MTLKDYDRVMEMIEIKMDSMKSEIMEAIENLALMTQREFVVVHNEIKKQGEDLREEMQEMGTELRGEMQEMKVELRGGMQEMKQELRDEMREMKTELQTEMQEMKVELQGEIQATRVDLHDEIEDLRRETRAGFAGITGIITNHEYRIERVEKKTGIS